MTANLSTSHLIFMLFRKSSVLLFLSFLPSPLLLGLFANQMGQMFLIFYYIPLLGFVSVPLGAFLLITLAIYVLCCIHALDRILLFRLTFSSRIVLFPMVMAGMA